MEIKVIGVGYSKERVKALAEDLTKAFGVPVDVASEVAAGIEQFAIHHTNQSEVDQYKLAKKQIKKALSKMRDDGISPDNAAIALSEVTCIFFEGMLKPVEGKTSKQAFLDYMGTIYDTTSERIKEVRAKREAERCNGR